MSPSRPAGVSGYTPAGSTPELPPFSDILTNGSLDFALTPAQQMTMVFSSFFSPSSTDLAANGFGDRMNSYAWSRAVFKDQLFVGTGRYPDTFQAMWTGIWGAVAPGTRPLQLPDAPVLPFIQDWFLISNRLAYVTNTAAYEAWKIAGQAEIWRFKKANPAYAWDRVYQSRLVPSFLRPLPPETNVITAPETMGFQSMIVFEDQAGASALFAFSGGLSLAPVAPVIFRTADGTNWTVVGTPSAMGRETRASAIHNRYLYVGASTTPGAVWRTDTSNPAATNWVQVLDFNTLDTSNSSVVSLASFNGKLYVGTENSQGYQVWCGGGTPGVNDWVKVVSDGAVDRYNGWAGTVVVFKNNLYVGSISLPWLSACQAFKGFDLIRIRPNNSWELIVGGGMPADPVPGTESLRPASRWASGFGNPMNFYCWNMCVFADQLYLGTFDGSVFLRYLSYLGPLPPEVQRYVDLVPRFGGSDLWQTCDGRFWRPVSLNGFQSPSNYGIRTMTVFNKRLIVGTANPFDGCEVISTPRMNLR